MKNDDLIKNSGVTLDGIPLTKLSTKYLAFDRHIILKEGLIAMLNLDIKSFSIVVDGVKLVSSETETEVLFNFLINNDE